MRSYEPTSLETLERRDRIHAQVVAVTGLRVGAGKAQDMVGTDQPIMRDGQGRPFLPGSAVKGALRSGLERVLRGLDRKDDTGLWACDVLDEQNRCTAALEAEAKTNRESVTLDRVRAAVCTACGLFGSTMMGGRLFVHDLPLAGGTEVRTEVRDGVGINRDLEVAQPKVKYDTEVVPPGTAFSLEMLLENGDDLQRALVLKVLEMVDEGQILLGGLTARGLGRVRLAGPMIETTDAARLLSGDGFAAKPWTEAQQEASKTLQLALSRREDGTQAEEEG